MGLSHHFDNYDLSQDRSQAFNFLQAIFGSQAGGFLEIRAFPSDKDKPIQKFFSIPSELDKVAALAISLKNQVYYSAAPRNQQKGTEPSRVIK